MDTVRALAYYRTNYLLGVARPGALTYDGARLALRSNELDVIWEAPLTEVRVTKGMGILTVTVSGEKVSILTAVGGRTSPRPSADLTRLLQEGTGIPGAPSIARAEHISFRGIPDVGVYAKGQKALREFFASLGVLA